MRLSLKDVIYCKQGILKKDYANSQFNNVFIDKNYLESIYFLEKKKKKNYPFFTKEYIQRNNKNVFLKVDSNYFLSQKNEDGIITLEFENVDNNGLRINTYRVEIIMNTYINGNNLYTDLQWVNITSDKVNRSIKYEVHIKGMNENGKDYVNNLTETNFEKEVIFNNDEDYKKIPYVEPYRTTHSTVSFENVIFCYKTYLSSSGNFVINDTRPIMTIKAVGELATDTINIYVKDIKDFIKYYRQGCIYTDNSFKGLNKISKKLYLGTREILEDEINNSEKVDTGHVRLFKETNYKQAKYIESDN